MCVMGKHDRYLLGFSRKHKGAACFSGNHRKHSMSLCFLQGWNCCFTYKKVTIIEGPRTRVIYAISSASFWVGWVGLGCTKMK